MSALFCDVQGYTSITERIGDEGAFRLMQFVTREVAETARRHGGVVKDYAGDGVMVLFGAPKAMENSALAAASAALDILSRFSTLRGQSAGIDIPHVRIGINTGPVVTGMVGDATRPEFGAFGDTVNIAARLQAIADPDTAWVSEATFNAIRKSVACVDRGDHAVKGHTGTIRVYRLEKLVPRAAQVGAQPAEARTKFIGRTEDLARLENAWHDAKTGHRRVILITGEAGLGKSRLIREFEQRVQEGGSSFLRGYCNVSSTAISFHPFIEIVRSAFRIPEGTEPAAAARNVRRGLEFLSLQSDQTAACLLHLLGQEDPSGIVSTTPSETFGKLTREAIQALLRERCRISPTIVIVEDLHWIDQASEECLDWVTGAEESLPLLLIATSRGGRPHRWAHRTCVEHLELKALSDTEALDMLKVRVSEEALAAAAARLVLSKADGNPLYLEAMADLIGKSADALAATDRKALRFETASVLDTLNGVLMEPVDRLSAFARQALDAASVVGHRFDLKLACDVAGCPGQLPVCQSELIDNGHIVATENPGEFSFRHALVRDAVYESLLAARRAQLHESIGQRLEAIYSERLIEVAEALAHHYSRAANLNKAVIYLMLAGDKSFSVYALQDAETRFSDALQLVDGHADSWHGDDLVDLLLRLARVYYFQARVRDLIALWDKFEHLLDGADAKKRARLISETGFAALLSGLAHKGEALLRRALAEGEALADEAVIGHASMGMMWFYVFWAPPGQARSLALKEHGQRALDAGNRLGDVWLVTKTLGAFSNDASIWGRPQEVKKYNNELLQLSRTTNDLRTKSESLFRLSYSLVATSEYDAAIEYADMSLKLSLSPVDLIFARHAKGMALVLGGNQKDGCAILEDVKRIMADGGLIQNGLFVELPYGAGLVGKGAIGKGLAQIKWAMRHYSQLGQPFAQAYGHWLLGEAYLQIAVSSVAPSLRVILKNLRVLMAVVPVSAWLARRELNKAVECAKALDNPMLLARSLCALGELAADRQKRAVAERHLAEARLASKSISSDYVCARLERVMLSKGWI